MGEKQLRLEDRHPSSSSSTEGQRDAPCCRCSSTGSWCLCCSEHSSSSHTDLPHSDSAKINVEHLWLRGDEWAAGMPRFLWVTLLFKVNTIILIITWISISIGCLRVGIYLHSVMQENVAVGMCKS